MNAIYFLLGWVVLLAITILAMKFAYKRKALALGIVTWLCFAGTSLIMGAIMFRNWLQGVTP